MNALSKDLVDALKGIVFDCNWQHLGKTSSFMPMKCYRLYSLDETEEDILLIKDKNDKFYAIDARCSHEGGPLDQGDIEELPDDKIIIVCPWHSFDFDLKNGLSSTGLKQQTFEIRIVNDEIYINTPTSLSLVSPLKTEVTNFSKEDKKDIKISQLTIADNTLSFWGCKILSTSDPKEKVALTNLVAGKYFNGELIEFGQSKPPDQPKRSESLNVIDPGKIRRGKGGTLASRIALLHSLANIEQWAIDLSWDIILRFGESVEFPDKTRLPKEFITDFIKVACDEAKHFSLLEKRLIELGSEFGQLPVHNGLWESATVTKDNFLSRLAIVHMVHEARGLDVHPQTRQRFLNQNDQESVNLLDILYKDEVTHVAAGLRWFEYGCNKYNYNTIETFHSLVKQYFKGYLKPPFDSKGRTIAGFSEEWYLPLCRPTS